MTQTGPLGGILTNRLAMYVVTPPQTKCRAKVATAGRAPSESFLVLLVHHILHHSWCRLRLGSSLGVLVLLFAPKLKYSLKSKKERARLPDSRRPLPVQHCSSSNKCELTVTERAGLPRQTGLSHKCVVQSRDGVPSQLPVFVNAAQKRN